MAWSRSSVDSRVRLIRVNAAARSSLSCRKRPFWLSDTSRKLTYSLYPPHDRHDGGTDDHDDGTPTDSADFHPDAGHRPGSRVLSRRARAEAAFRGAPAARVLR